MSGIEHYAFGKIIGEGTYAKVKLCKHLATGLNVAIKILNKRQMQQSFDDLADIVQREICILSKFHHPHVIRFYEHWETAENIYLVTEYVHGGDLCDYIEHSGHLCEQEAKRYFQQIVSAVDYCHRHKITHRDLKPENILLDEDGNVKLGDFGLSNFMQDGEWFRTACGSPNFVAPEIISGRPYCGQQVDMWSLGVVLYVLLVGYLPFDENNIGLLFRKITKGDFAVPAYISNEARDLICRLLNPDPIARITMHQVIHHPFYKQHLPLYLKISEFTVGKTLPSAHFYKAGKTTRIIDQQVFDKCLAITKLPKSQKLVSNVFDGVKNAFTVCYELLMDEKLKENRKWMVEHRALPEPFFTEDLTVSLSISPSMISYSNSYATSMTSLSEDFWQSEDTTSQTQQSKRPTNWTYGIERTPKFKLQQLASKIFTKLRKRGLEWRVIGPFKIRVRKRGGIAVDKSNFLKFDLAIYQ